MARLRAPIAAAAVAFAWLAWPGADPLVALFNMDVLYHIHRISRCAADLPWVTSVDTYSHVGAPWHLHWPGPHALPYALLVRLAGAAPGDLLAVTRIVSWVPPLLGAVAAAATVRLGRRCGLTEAWAFVAGLACALSGDALVAFHHGAVDHHAVTAAVLPLAATAWLDRSLRAWAGWTFVLLAMTPEATPYLTLMLVTAAACEGLSSAADPLTEPSGLRWLHFVVPAIGAACALALDRALDPQRGDILELSPFRLSPFQFAWLLVIGLAAAGLTMLPRRGRTLAERWTILGGLSLGAVSLLLLMLMGFGWLEDVATRLGRVERQQVGEEISLLRFLQAVPDTHWGAWAVLLILVAIAATGRLLLVRGRGRLRATLVSAALPAGAVCLGLLELRHARALAALIAVALVSAFVDTIRALVPAELPRARTWRIAAGCWLAALALPAFAWHALVLRATVRAPVTWPTTIGALCTWARTSLPDAGRRDRPPVRAVFGPWEWGHHLNAMGGFPVVVDGFNHEEATNQASWDTWLAETGEAFADAAERHGATHVVVTQAAGAIAGLLQRTSYEVVRRAPDAPGGALWMPALRRHAAFRLDEGGGIADASGRLLPLWASTVTRPLAVLDGEVVRVVDVPAARLFEIVPGAEIVGERPPGASLRVECRYRIGADGREIAASRGVTADEAGVVRFRVALPAPHVAFPLVVLGPHRVVGAGGEVEVVVTAADVRMGRRIALPAEPGSSSAAPGP